MSIKGLWEEGILFSLPISTTNRTSKLMSLPLSTLLENFSVLRSKWLYSKSCKHHGRKTVKKKKKNSVKAFSALALLLTLS